MKAFIKLFFLLSVIQVNIYAQTFPSNEQLSNRINHLCQSDTNNINPSRFDSFIVAKFSTGKYNDCISFTKIAKPGETIIILWQSDDQRTWHASNWYRKGFDKIEIIDINNDSIYEIMLTKEDTIDHLYKKYFELISLKSGKEDILFYTNEYEYIIKYNKLDSLEVGTIISKRHKIQFKDINKDGSLDIKDKMIKKYLKSRKCSCDDDFEYKIEKRSYLYENGNYVKSGF